MTTVEDLNSYRLQDQLRVPKNIDKHFKLLNFVGVGVGGCFSLFSLLNCHLYDLSKIISDPLYVNQQVNVQSATKTFVNLRLLSIKGDVLSSVSYLVLSKETPSNLTFFFFTAINIRVPKLCLKNSEHFIKANISSV